MMLNAHTKVRKDGFVTNLFGRKRRLPEALNIDKYYGKKTLHADLPYTARGLLNQAVNFPIQSSGGSIVNRASIMFDNNRKLAEIDCQIVCQVHDSLVVECNESDAETVSILLQDALENAVPLKGISFEAIPKIGKSLAEV